MLKKVLLLSFLTRTDSKLRKCSSDEVDSISWRVKGDYNDNKDCSTLESEQYMCKRISDDGILGHDACPVACSVCCADSTNWKSKKSKKTCDDINKKNRKGVCNEIGSNRLLGYQACKKSCKSCPNIYDEYDWYYENNKGRELSCSNIQRNPERRCPVLGKIKKTVRNYM